MNTIHKAYEIDLKELKKLMIDCELETITDLAEKSNVDRQTVTSLFSGKSKPSATTMYKIARALKMTPEQAGRIFFKEKLTQ